MHGAANVGAAIKTTAPRNSGYSVVVVTRGRTYAAESSRIRAVIESGTALSTRCHATVIPRRDRYRRGLMNFCYHSQTGTTSDPKLAIASASAPHLRSAVSRQGNKVCSASRKDFGPRLDKFPQKSRGRQF